MTTIRLATPADVPALARLAQDTFVQAFVEGHAIAYPEDDLAAFLTASYALDKVGGWIADPRGHVIVAEDRDGALIGYAQSGDNELPYADARPGDGELKRLYVRRERQGGGLGGALLERSLARLGDRAILIGVWSENFGAQRLYARHGFEKVGEYHFMVGLFADAEFILRRGALQTEFGVGAETN